MKQKLTKQNGFTLVELMVVISIMALLMGALILNFNASRASRSVVFAQNETVTNIRKVQSYMLSSRDISDGLAAKFYYIKFTKGQPTYTIGAIDKNFSLHENLETVTLPGGVTISDLKFVQATDNTHQYMCVLFSAPFGKMFFVKDDSCSSNLLAVAQDPTTLYELNDASVEVVLAPNNGAASKSIDIHSLTGRIDSNAELHQYGGTQKD